MSTHKHIDLLCVLVLLFTLGLTSLFMNGEALGLTVVPGESSGLFTSNDLEGDWDTSTATRITLSDQGSSISGNGAYVYDGDVYIAYPGRYVLTGELTDGSVIVSASRTDKIWLALENVSLHCEDSAALQVEQADKVFLTLVEGTVNTISSGAEFSAEAESAGVDGAVYSRDDLTINGSGALVVDGAYYHGIVCNDDLVITGGELTVTAVQDGLHANDSVRIREASIHITAGDDGITVSNDDETAFFYMESGSVTIPACYEGVEAIDITIAGGTLNITPEDDGINANGSGVRSVIRITGGDITVTNAQGRDGDGLDSNGSIYIEGGRVFLSVSDSGGNCALDYGSENGGECVISGGTVIACGSSMMAEGFSPESPQGFLMYSTSGTAGSVIRLEDSSGKVLLSEEIPCSFSSAVLSTPELKVGDVCTVSVDGVSEQVTIDNTAVSAFRMGGMGGTFGGGMRGGRGMAAMSGETFGETMEEPPADGGGQMGRGPRENLEGQEDVEAWAGMRPQGGTESPENAEPPGRPDWQPSGEDGGTAPAPFPENGAQGFRERGEANQTAAQQSNLPADVWVLLGISVLSLLIGLLVAVKIKH